MNTFNLTLESPVSDFEYSINKIIRELEYHSEDLARRRSQYGDARHRGKSGEEFLQGFYIHVRSLKKILELMLEAEQFASDMEDEPEDGDYARGQLQSLKQVFIAVCKQASISIEEWVILENESSKYGRDPLTARGIFYSLMTKDKIAKAYPLPVIYDNAINTTAIGLLDNYKKKYI